MVKEDLTGKRFGRLTVIEKFLSGKKGTHWRCKCECGGEKIVITYKLKAGKVSSCGCLERENRENLKKITKKHGMTNTILYGKWCSMKERCYNPNYKYFHRYGGRGIRVCNEWLGEHGFENFAKWSYESGYDESKKGYEQSIDRKDTDGNYCPENCKWSNQLEQVKNRSNSFLITDVDGEKLTHVQFSLKHGIPPKILFAYRRMKKGLSAQEILNEWTEHVKFNSDNYYTVETASLYYNVCAETIKIWIHKGLIQAEKNRGKWYIPKDQTKCCI